MRMRLDDPDAVAVVEAIQAGDTNTLRRLLDENPELATATVGSEEEARSLLHIATDWPGNFPNIAATVAALVEAGADVNAPFVGAHTETPLHWAASSDDVPALDALLDNGADINAPGAVIAGGTPLADATAFGQWNAARRLVERGALSSLWESAALGLVDRVQSQVEGASADEITEAFWGACHGGQKGTAEFLLDSGAELNWVGWDELTPLDAARRSGADDLADWLVARGATAAGEAS
jgi:uncharacterized protein